MRPILLDYAASLGHTVFEKGEYNLNIIGIRTPDDSANSFNDRICVAYKDGLGWVTRTWAATTDPGLYWRENPGRIEGTAILVPGQYRGCWKLGRHRGKYPALVQQGGMVKVYRDANKNEVLDMDPDTEKEGYFGINIHKAGDVSTEVNKWSAGCQVFARVDDFSEFMSLCYSARNLWGDSFSYSLIQAPEF